MKIFKGDKWTRLIGSPIPEGSLVKIIKDSYSIGVKNDETKIIRLV